MIMLFVMQTSLLALATTVMSANTLGVMVITSSNRNTVVAVPFAKIGSMVESIDPAKFVSQANLTEGDLLYAFKDDVYKGWRLDGSGNWVAVANNEIGSDGLPMCEAADENYTVAMGSGIWLVRKDEPVGTFRFYVYGDYRGEPVSTINAGAKNLIANPLGFRARPVLSSTPAEGDALLVPGSGPLPLRWTFRGGAWRHDGKAASLPVFAVGHGAWYISKGDVDMSCSWQAE